MDPSQLPVDHGFRLRGEQVTRLETFVDAAFAFAVTLLVVSFQSMPDTFEKLYDAFRRLPAFLAGFAILMLFWQAHNRFRLRFGLEDGMAMTLGLGLVATTLFYVYPLRMVMSAAMHFFTGGWAPSEFSVTTYAEYQWIFVVYGAGFAVLATIIAGLNLHGLRRADALQLDAAERMLVRGEIEGQLALIACALLSVTLALLLPPRDNWLQALPGLSYSLLGVLMPILGVRNRRQVQALLVQRAW